MVITDWVQQQAALREAVGRVTALLRSSPDPAQPALGSWSLGEVAMHLSQVWVAVPGLARADLSEMFNILPEVAGPAGDSLVPAIWDLDKFTMRAVEADPERGLAVLADRIEERAERYLAGLAGHAPDEPRTWLVQGATVPQQMLTCHLLSETIMHGFDMAQAAGQPWPIGPVPASMVLSGFVMQVIRALPPTDLVVRDRAGDATATFDLRIRGSRSWHLVFTNGELRAEDPAPRRVDCHISAEPEAMLLLMWGRRSQWRAIARGQIVAWGRKPWLGTALRSMICNP
jgi:hypothetical protein